MLATSQNIQRSQLLEDLMAVKERLEKGWLKGGFQSGDKVCIVAACNQVTEQKVGNFNRIVAGTDDSSELRLGRLIYAIYRALYGPKADTSVSITHAQAKIAAFNDKHANHGAVLLLIDRAMAVCMEPVEASA